MKTDALVEKLEKASREYDGLAMLVGLVGTGKKKGHIRLYLRPQLDWYVDFDADAVVHQQELPEGSSLLGGSILWVKPLTPLSEVRGGALAHQASFLRGGLTGEAFPGGAMPGQGVQAMATTTVTTSSGPCLATGTIAATIVLTAASYYYCNSLVWCPTGGTLQSALSPGGCPPGPTTGPTVICHPQTVPPLPNPNPPPQT